jgi:DNA-binding transcriptional LysR family regulator
VPTFHVEAADYASAIAFVAAGIGVRVLPNLGARDLPAGIVAVPITHPIPRRKLMLRVRASLSVNPAAVRAVELFHKAAAQS